MKFNIVIGNPPYNNDIYLDFIELAHSISNKFTCMVVPAKWKAKGTERNVAFRVGIMPYISTIMSYRNTKDIFDIGEPGGISIILTDKIKHTTQLVKSVCDKNGDLNTDGFEEHSINSITLWSNRVNSLIEKIRPKDTSYSIGRSLRFSRNEFTGEQERGTQVKTPDSVEVIQGDNLIGYIDKSELFTTSNLEKYKCIQSCMTVQGSGDPFGSDGTQVLGSNLIMVVGPNQVPKGSFQVLRYFDTEKEANSFKSYINSKTMSFLQFFGICGTQMTPEFFRFIPEQTDWSRVYVDSAHIGAQLDTNGNYTYNGIDYCSLYAKYNLTKSDISLIESVIRERK